MSQLADLEMVVSQQPMKEEDRARLFFDIIEAFNWDVDGVKTVEDAILYLRGMR